MINTSKSYWNNVNIMTYFELKYYTAVSNTHVEENNTFIRRNFIIFLPSRLKFFYGYKLLCPYLVTGRGHKMFFFRPRPGVWNNYKPILIKKKIIKLNYSSSLNIKVRNLTFIGNLVMCRYCDFKNTILWFHFKILT